MKKILILLFVLLTTITTYAQTRYLDSLFMVSKTDSAVIYGQAEAIYAPYLSEGWTWTQDLLMDIYQPQGDIETVRPCILFVHGGAFYVGARDDASPVNVCKDMVEKGYVAVSIDYRLGFNTLSSESAERAVYRGVQDVKAAIRFLKENQATYGIDTSRIFGMGSSAGSVALIHAAYMEDDERANITSTFNTPDLNCLSCSGNTLSHNDKPTVLANLWGAIVDTNFIEAGDAPMVSFHGTDDIIVSPDSAKPFNSPFFPALSGTNYMTPRLENLGINTAYYKFYGQGHEPWGVLSETPYYDTIINQTTLFFYNYLQQNLSFSLAQKSNFQNFKIYPNPVTDFVNINLEVNENGRGNMLIYSTLGQIIQTESINIIQGKNHLKTNISHLKNGYYYLVIEINDQRISKMIFKK